MIKLVVYDLDGTLVDSATTVSSILNQMRLEIDKKPLAHSSLIPWLSLGGEELIINSLDVDKVEAKKYLDIFRSRYLSMPTPIDSLYQGVIETLDKLSAANINLAICTNKPRKLAEKVLKETGIFEKFSYMVAGDDLLTKKPHPNNLEICLENFSATPNNSIMIGDSSVDFLMAKSLNIRFIQYIPGYDDGIVDLKITNKIKNHLDLIKLIEN